MNTPYEKIPYRHGKAKLSKKPAIITGRNPDSFGSCPLNKTELITINGK